MSQISMSQIFMKAFFVLVLLAALSAASLAKTDSFLVVPGRSLGRIHLGRRGAVDIKRLAPPDHSYTSKHGIYYAAWRSRTSSDTLAVNGFDNEYAQPPHPGLELDEIRATSPQFHTPGGLAPGATLAEIKRQYPKGKLQPVSNGDDGDTDVYYDVAGKGLGFEFPAHPAASTRSIAIAVSKPDDGFILSAHEIQHDLEQ